METQNAHDLEVEDFAKHRNECAPLCLAQNILLESISRASFLFLSIFFRRMTKLRLIHIMKVLAVNRD